MARRLTQALAVLLAVCVAATAASTPSLGDLLRQSAGSGRVSTASVQDDPYGYDQYGIETKELCLQETEMKACGWTNNCANDDATPGLPVCVTGQFWTSDFACCQEQHYGYDGPTGLRHSQLWSHAANIGTCDWTVTYVDLRNLDFTLVTAGVAPALATAVTTPGSTDITSNIAKLGSAWATCYLGADSETCGGPLCDRMVMSMQGTVYRATQAYSHWSATTTATNALCVAVNGPIDVVNGPPGNPGTAANPPGRVAGQDAVNPPRVLNDARSPLQVGPASTGAQLQYSGHNGYYDNDSTNRAVFRGPATIIMGIINGMAGQHKEKWDEGVFEYVPYFLPDVPVTASSTAIGVVAGNPMATPVSIDASYPWVRDKTYKITFYRGAKY